MKNPYSNLMIFPDYLISLKVLQSIKAQFHKQEFKAQ